MDTSFSPELEGVIIKNGNDALAVWLRILQEMYKRGSDEIEATNATISTLSLRSRVDPERFKEIVREFADENVFSLHDWLESNKIISHGVAKQIKHIQTIRKETRKRVAEFRQKERETQEKDYPWEGETE